MRGDYRKINNYIKGIDMKSFKQYLAESLDKNILKKAHEYDLCEQLSEYIEDLTGSVIYTDEIDKYFQGKITLDTLLSYCEPDNGTFNKSSVKSKIESWIKETVKEWDE